MTQPHLRLEEAFRLLPLLAELDELRMGLAAVAIPDPEKEWEKSSLFATVDRRIVRRGDLERAVIEAEAKLVAEVRDRFAALKEIFDSYFAGNTVVVAQGLVEMGEREERRSRTANARAFYEQAFEIALSSGDRSGQALALRRLARLVAGLGEMEEALELYRRSVVLAVDSGSLRGEVVALTGIGNVRAIQGWWEQADEQYRKALERAQTGGADAEFERELGHLYNNLALTALRRGLVGESQRWILQALPLWERVASCDDLAICYNTLAMLRDQQGDTAEAMAIRHRALELDISAGNRAVIAIDLAQSYAAAGQLTEAHRLGREAEQHAIEARSPYHLGHMYRGLGNIARSSGEVDGFVFFEKALEIARYRQLPFLEGETLVDYADLRASAGGADEAAAYLQRALTIFAELGAQQEEERARLALLQLARSSLRPEQA